MKFYSFVLTIAIVLGALASGAEAQEIKERIIERLPVEKGEPVAISQIKVNGQEVSLDKNFRADDDWLRNLVISVRNTSEKRILFASVRLQFPRPAGLEEVMSVHDISWGKWALQVQLPNPEEQLAGIKPGETENISLTAQQFAELRDFLSMTHYPHNIDRVSLSISHIIFDDDTMWYAGAIFRRDPKDPTIWRNSQVSNSKSQ